MERDDWSRVKDLFAVALERPPAERREFLLEATGGREKIVAEVESLLAAHVEADEDESGFIDEPAGVVDDELFQAIASSWALGRRVGAYRLVRQLGQGGMGVVYLAERADDSFAKEVAIKLIRPGAESQDLLGRFHAERQTLARLEHPGIARLVDGGTADYGLPYLVMEYVQGEPLDEYADRLRLGVKERLLLFLQVCAAVAYLHRNLVVHRDLKPRNVFVTGDGRTKLLDFGIAKLLAADGDGTPAVTRTLVRAMTPEYASPEQVRGEPVTTATDVYSLGVMLYRLLTGCEPYQFDSHRPGAIERVICERHPERPSVAAARAGAEVASARGASPARLARRIAGDLDRIVAKAMAKEPSRRYASVDQLADDLERHLEGQPVRARGPDRLYRLQRLLARNRSWFAASFVALAALGGGLVVVARETARAEMERARAEARFNDLRRLVNDLLFEVDALLTPLPGATAARQVVLERAVEHLDHLAQSSSWDPELLRELAVAYEKVGDLQGHPNRANLGDLDGALASYQRSLSIRQQLAVEEATSEDRRLLATTNERIASVQLWRNDPAGAEARLERALGLLLELATGPGGRVARDLGRCLLTLDEVLAVRGRETDAYARRADAVLAAAREPEWEARARIRLALRDHREVVPAAVADTLAQWTERVGAVPEVVLGWTDLGEVWRGADPEAAGEAYERALGLAEGLAASDPSNVAAQRLVAVSARGLASLVAERARSEGLARESVDAARALCAAVPASWMAARELAASLEVLATVAVDPSDRRDARAEADRMARRSVRLVERGETAESAGGVGSTFGAE